MASTQHPRTWHYFSCCPSRNLPTAKVPDPLHLLPLYSAKLRDDSGMAQTYHRLVQGGSGQLRELSLPCFFFFFFFFFFGGCHLDARNRRSVQMRNETLTTIYLVEKKVSRDALIWIPEKAWSDWWHARASMCVLYP